MATKGKCSVGHLSSMSLVDRVLLDESSILNTELVIAKIQKQNFHIHVSDFFFFCSRIWKCEKVGIQVNISRVD